MSGLRARFLILTAVLVLVTSIILPSIIIWQLRAKVEQRARVTVLNAINDGQLLLEKEEAGLLELLWWVCDAGLVLLEGGEMRPYHHWALMKARTAAGTGEIDFVLVSDLEGRPVWGLPGAEFPRELTELARTAALMPPAGGSLRGAVELGAGGPTPQYCLVRAEQVLSGDRSVGSVVVGKVLGREFLASWMRQLNSTSEPDFFCCAFLFNSDGQPVVSSAGQVPAGAGFSGLKEEKMRGSWEGEVYLDGTLHRAATLVLRHPLGQPTAVLAVIAPEEAHFYSQAERLRQQSAAALLAALALVLAAVYLALNHLLLRPLNDLIKLMETTYERIKGGLPPPRDLPELPDEIGKLAEKVSFYGQEYWRQKTHQQELSGLISRLAQVMTPQEGLKVLAYHLQRPFAGGEGVDAVVFHLIYDGEETGEGAGPFVEKTGEVPACESFPENPNFCPAHATGSFVVQDSAREFPCINFRPGAGSYRCRALSIGGRTLGVLHLYSARPGFFANETRVRLEEVVDYCLPVIANLLLLEETTRQSLTDTLTGLYNRRFLEAFLDQQLALYQRTSQPFAVLMADLDRFKQFNDTFGHRAGDAALRAVAQVLKKGLRASDIVARYGGEEFVAVLPQTGVESAVAIAERLRQAVAAAEIPDPQNPGFNLPPLTVSVGVACCPEHGKTLGDLLHASDVAMYEAKQAGRNRVKVASAAPADDSGSV